MTNKVPKVFKKVNTFAVINAILIILAFVAPTVAFVLSAILLTFLAILYCLGKIIGRRINRAVEKAQEEGNIENLEADADEEAFKRAIEKIFRIFFHGFDEGEDPPTETWVKALLVLAFAIFFAMAFWKWLGMALVLTIPSVMLSFVMIYTGSIGDNLEIFLHVVIIYFFLRLYVTFTLTQLNVAKRVKIIPMAVKMLLEAARIVVIVITVLNMDCFTGINMPPSLLHGIVATIAIDTIIKEALSYISKKNKGS